MDIKMKMRKDLSVCFASRAHFSGGLIHRDVCHDEFKFHIFPPVRLEKLCHLGLEVQFAKRLMALYDSTI